MGEGERTKNGTVRVILLGPPGAGKGTQAQRVADALSVSRVSSGDLLREHRKRGTELGRLAGSYMDRGDLVETGVAAELSDQVRSLARLSQACGLDGIVCSALDLRHLGGSVDADFLRVTPGIRIKDDDDDQRRVTTPGDAIRAGADFLVIGRSITRAPNPIAVLDLIERDVAACGA